MTSTLDNAPPSASANEDAFIPALRPLDEHNRRLQANTHPLDWINPEPRGRYNLVVIGAGTAGLVAAAGAAGLGAKVALIEKGLMGGDCLNVGCVPSKALIRCARAASDARDAGRFGVRVAGPVAVDFAAVMERMRRLHAGISPNDSARRFKDLGVDVFLGQARFAGPDTVAVAGKTLRFARAVIATGARATAPPIEGLADGGYLTNETVFSLAELPARLAVIGAGPIGCEMAQAFARFGSRVTLIEADKRILIREDEGAARHVEAVLKRDGVEVICGGKAAGVTRRGDEKVIRLECGGQFHEVAVEAILVGVGRAPNVEGLDLEATGVKYDRRAGVAVNDFLQTSNPRIYAAGAGLRTLARTIQRLEPRLRPGRAGERHGSVERQRLRRQVQLRRLRERQDARPRHVQPRKVRPRRQHLRPKVSRPDLRPRHRPNLFEEPLLPARHRKIRGGRSDRVWGRDESLRLWRG